MAVKKLPYRDILDFSVEELYSIASRRSENLEVQEGDRRWIAELNEVEEGGLLADTKKSAIGTHPSQPNFEPSEPHYGVVSHHEDYDSDAKELAEKLDDRFEDVDIIYSQRRHR